MKTILTVLTTILLINVNANSASVKQLWQKPSMPFSNFDVSEDGRFLAGTVQSAIQVIEISSSKVMYSYEDDDWDHEQGSVFFINNHEIICVFSDKITKYDFINKKVMLLMSFPNRNYTCKVSHDKKYLADLSFNSITIVDLIKNNNYSFVTDIGTMTSKGDFILDLEFSPDNTKIMFITYKNYLLLYDMETRNFEKVVNLTRQGENQFDLVSYKISMYDDSSFMTNYTNKIRIWDINTFKLKREIIIPVHMQYFAKTPDNKYIVITHGTGIDFPLIIYDIEKNTYRTTKDIFSVINRSYFSFVKGTSNLIAFDENDDVVLYNYSDEKVVDYPIIHSGNGICFFNNDESIITTNYRCLSIINANSGKLEKLMRIKNCQSVYDIKISKDQKILTLIANYVGKYSNFYKIRIYDFISGELLHIFPDTIGVPITVKYSPDGKYLAACGGDSTMIIWDLDDYSVYRFKKFFGLIEGLEFSENSNKLYIWCVDRSGDNNNKLYTYNVESDEIVCSLVSKHFGKSIMIHHKNNEWLYCQPYGYGGVHLIDPCTKEELQTFIAGAEIINFVISDDSKLMITNDEDSVVKFWDMESTKYYEDSAIYEIPIKDALPKRTKFAFSQNSKKVIISDAFRMTLYDISQITDVNDEEPGINGFSISPNPVYPGGEVSISGIDTPVRDIQVYSLTGELIIRKASTSSRISFTLPPGIIPGIYFVRTTLRNGSMITKKLIVGE